MCGIVGIIAKTSIPYHGDVLFKQMLQMDTVRGEDSTGVFGVNAQGEVDVLKADTDGWTFTESGTYNKFHKRMWNEYKIAIGHNRAATRGAVTAFNAHPFKEKNIVLVHNGTIRNADDLNKEVEVDSHAIAHALSEHKAEEALEKINGAFALVWFDMKTNTLHLARNKERPLALLEYEDCWLISSEVWMPQWLQLRQNRGEAKKLMSVPVEKILTFQLDDLPAGPTEIAYKEFSNWKPYVPVKTTQYSYPDYSASNRNVPVVNVTRDVPKFGSTNVQALLMQRIQQMDIKAGMIIRFKADDYAEPEANDKRLIGKPFLQQKVDESIVVQAHLKRDQTIAELLESGSIFTAKVMNVRPVQGKIVWFVQDVEPVVKLKDINDREYDVTDAARILGNGCGKCGGIMRLSDFAECVCDVKADKTIRLRCKHCVADSLKAARQSINIDEELEQLEKDVQASRSLPV